MNKYYPSIRRIPALVIYALCLMFLLLPTSCRKKHKTTACEPDEICTNAGEQLMSDDHKSFIMTKDTVLAFVSADNDTMKLRFRSKRDLVESETFSCGCDISRTLPLEEYRADYEMLNRDLAWSYYSKVVFGSQLLTIAVSDTNVIFHNADTIPSYSSPISLFVITNRQAKFTESVLLRNKTYQVYKHYDMKEIDPRFFSECYYTPAYGIVRFKYKGKVYEILG